MGIKIVAVTSQLDKMKHPCNCVQSIVICEGDYLTLVPVFSR